MKRSNGVWKGLVGVAAAVLLSGVIHATTVNTLIDTTALNAAPSVLPLGARIVAGDPAKNEFFIVGKNDTQPVKMVVTKHTRVLASKEVIKRLKFAAKHSHSHAIASKRDISKIKLALNQPSHKVRGNKAGLQLKTALKKNKRHLALKKKASKVAVAMNQTDTKIKSTHITE